MKRKAHPARTPAPLRQRAQIDRYLGQHLAIAEDAVEMESGRQHVVINEAESPLAWLARRKGRDGRPLIEPVQLQAGERLRRDFTYGQLTPRVTSIWTAAVADGRRAPGSPLFSDTVLAARQRVRHALQAAGPDFAGLLLDVCCFLKGLEDVERERAWPPRSGKVVLQLALDCLARHYGFRAEMRGPARAAIRTWSAPDSVFAEGE